ncbi:MAG: hypothetical protein SGJ18_02015 [Pseudomonadota bacterium]|nr:hypothetical protein [Pseudomonadota bacterium]
MRILTFLSLFLLLSGCTLFGRSSNYGPDIYEADPELLDYYHEKQNLERSQAKAQVRALSPKGEISDAAIERKQLLNRLEYRIANKKESELYYRYKPYFSSDSQRIRFLQTDSYDTKIDWLRHYKITTEIEKFQPQVQAMIDASDITLGMQKEAVVQSWGEPEAKEISGNPTYGNERWKYVKHVPENANYGLETRYVYFEGGLVSGWEKY